jgi:integrase/recombinase XerD
MSTPLLDSFAAYLRMERGLAENTVASYLLDLAQFSNWLTVPLEKAKRENVQKFLAESLKGGTDARSVTRKTFSLRRFYCFLLDEGTIRKDPTLGIPLPKREKKVQYAISQAEVEAMVASLGASPHDLRDRAILLLLFGSGLRASELTNLKLQDISLETGIVQIWCGKGAKDGIVPLSSVSIAALREYLANGRPQLDPKSECLHLFVGRWSTHGHGKPFTRQNLYQCLARLSERVLGKRVSPHRFRAGCATALLEGGSDIRDTQRIMRHALIDTTQMYLGISMTFLRTNYYKFHPRAKGASDECSN